MIFAPAVQVVHAARALAEATYPEEGCALLLGRAAGAGEVRVERIFPLPNAHPGDRGRRYAVDRLAYEAGEREAESLGLAPVGVFHTHPDSPPVPSSIDSDFAFPGWVYWIASVRAGSWEAARAWYRTEAGEWVEAVGAEG